ncbi:AAA family ATPase [Leptolyngbya cf. ectocarpi LEGE 11479]|uniref:AAA family ATPase n=1 Tax=Leptolyngbya cf. ectocarpi LEGE 11479 TaxID=1828722 RepID=A0A928X2A1_LEPEC|nr:AAA family ATPase [Leptolyngbya ectocarpi]MBE9067127.1 AAA family ATPase [Leptolyngbya cf. ectocarpi LEGE 11479]
MIVEIVGVAGAGKTTILSHLIERHPTFEPIFEWRRLSHLPAYVRSAVSLFPVWFTSRITGQPLPWKGINWMIRLKALNHLLQHQPSGHGSVIILDQGPVYTFARLLDYGLTENAFSSEWMMSCLIEMLSHSAEILDAVILLDAPNDILSSRIRNRHKPHRMKQSSEQVVQSFLNQHRLAYIQTLERLKAGKNTNVLTYNTHQQSIGEVVTDIASQCSVCLAVNS